MCFPTGRRAVTGARAAKTSRAQWKGVSRRFAAVLLSLGRSDVGRRLMLVKRRTVMNREPDRHLVGIGPLHAVSRMRRDIKKVAALKPDGVDVPLKGKHRGALKNKNPLGMLLVEPKSRRACLPVRDDPLDA